MNETFEDILAAGGLPQEDEAVSVVGGEIGGGISGGGTFDGSKYALKNHTHKFKMPDNQTIRTPEILGGFIRNTEIDIKNATGKNIFNVKRTGANTGDVTIGNYSGGAGALWDYSAGVFDIKGTIHATSGEIGGWTIASTTLTATSITLDSGNERIAVGASNPILIDGANKKIESDNYVSGYTGAGFHIDEDKAEFGNIACRGLIRSSVFQKGIVSAMGGNFMVLDSDVLDADMTADDTETLTTKGTTTFSTGDILRIKDADDDEFMEVTAVNGNTYTVTRDKAGAYGADANPAWKKGATVVNYGQSGDGGVYMTASESNAPYLSVFTHSGSPWTDLTTRLRIGNLNGYLGYSSDLYGIAIGDTDKYLKYDPTNSLRISGRGLEDYKKLIFTGNKNDGFIETSGSTTFTRDLFTTSMSGYNSVHSWAMLSSGDFGKYKYIGDLLYNSGDWECVMPNLSINTYFAQDYFFGFMNDANRGSTELPGGYTGNHIGFFIDTSNNLWATNANGSNQTITQITGIALSNSNCYSFKKTSSSIKFYVNDILKVTHTTNIPGAVVPNLQYSCDNNASTEGFRLVFGNNYKIIFN